MRIPLNLELPNELAYLFGEYTNNYLHDMAIPQDFASENRKTMREIILEKMNFTQRRDAL
ncbi:conserved hypothetical protein [Treponema phagedenis]|uniref:Uncharacterized protein n=1 Tax=Treponema phagedenis TaxID=162 RepID=A0A0B7H2H4_TREPH|nr:hypothetical protein HMPREF9554_00577 [Treponema phagedenis F0421]CEM63445.1 conserved hypothetical protein [Treponema phagedenis]